MCRLALWGLSTDKQPHAPTDARPPPRGLHGQHRDVTRQHLPGRKGVAAGLTGVVSRVGLPHHHPEQRGGPRLLRGPVVGAIGLCVYVRFGVADGRGERNDEREREEDRTTRWKKPSIPVPPIHPSTNPAHTTHQHAEVGPAAEEVSVGEDGVRLRQVPIHQRHDRPQLPLPRVARVVHGARGWCPRRRRPWLAFVLDGGCVGGGWGSSIGTRLRGGRHRKKWRPVDGEVVTDLESAVDGGDGVGAGGALPSVALMVWGIGLCCRETGGRELRAYCRQG